jgi:hypothetical protein
MRRSDAISAALFASLFLTSVAQATIYLRVLEDVQDPDPGVEFKVTGRP